MPSTLGICPYYPNVHQLIILTRKFDELCVFPNIIKTEFALLEYATVRAANGSILGFRVRCRPYTILFIHVQATYTGLDLIP